MSNYHSSTLINLAEKKKKFHSVSSMILPIFGGEKSSYFTFSLSYIHNR